MLTSKSGQSLVESFETKTYHEMMNSEINTLLTARHFWGWPQVWVSVGEKTKYFAGKSGIGHDWRRWQHRCLAFDFEIGLIVSYINGVEDGRDIADEKYIIDPLKEVNEKIKTKNLVTDVMVGCDPWKRSYGRIVDLQVFDRVLTHDEMVEMTTCHGKKLEGNLINSNRSPFTLFGPNAKNVTVHPEEICPTRNLRERFHNEYESPIHYFVHSDSLINHEMSCHLQNGK